MNLENNVALVTGGASGLGRGTVEYFVSKGAKAVILDINCLLYTSDAADE